MNVPLHCYFFVFLALKVTQIYVKKLPDTFYYIFTINQVIEIISSITTTISLLSRIESLWKYGKTFYPKVLSLFLIYDVFKNIFHRSSKCLKMDAYDTAVLSYALATAASKIKPGLLGVAPNLGIVPQMQQREDSSLTPPSKENLTNEEVDLRNFYSLLMNLEQTLLNNYPVQISQFLEICSYKQVSNSKNK